MEAKKTSNVNYARMFNNEVVKWRQNAAKLWSILIIFAIILMHSVSANYNPITNFSAFFLGFFINIFSGYLWLCSGFVCFIFWALFSFNDQLFRVTPKVYSNNLEKIIQNVYSLHSVCLLTNIGATVLISYSFLKFYDYDKQINYYYVCGFCAMSNFIMKFQFAFQEKYLLTWPIIEHTKLVRFKSRVYGLVIGCFKSIFMHMVIWKVLYFVIGSFIRSSNSSASDSISSFMTSYIAMKIAFLINVSHTINWLIYEIYMTEIYRFNIQSNVHSPFCLPTSMSLNSYSYIQTLALIDFANLSIYSKTKRKQLFNLSYTNSKPVNWNKVSGEALNVIKNFMEIFNFDDMLHGKVSNLPETPTRFSSNVLRRVTITSPLREENINSFKSPTKQQQQPKEPQTTLPNVFIQKLLGYLKKQRVFSHVYKENTNYKTEQLFVDSFLVINALKGLSNMVMVSFSEDEYGIVQQTLTDIIHTFISLQKILEKFNSTTSSTSISFKILQKSDTNKIELLMQKLTFILNESMFKVTQTFGPSLKSLPLGDEAMQRLKRFYLSQ